MTTTYAATYPEALAIVEQLHRTEPFSDVTIKIAYGLGFDVVSERNARLEYDRGLITLVELVELDPFIDSEWIADQWRQIDEAAARYSWKCASCGNQDRRGRVGERCWFCGGGDRPAGTDHTPIDEIRGSGPNAYPTILRDQAGRPVDDTPTQCPECGIGDSEYGLHESDCPSGGDGWDEAR